MVRITEHALDKYQQVTGCASRDTARLRLHAMLRKAVRVVLDPEIAAQRILNNPSESGRLEEPEYYEFEQYRMVIVDGVMVTFEKKYKTRMNRRKT